MVHMKTSGSQSDLVRRNRSMLQFRPTEFRETGIIHEDIWWMTCRHSISVKSKIRLSREP